jgi:hypothetical protein
MRTTTADEAALRRLVEQCVISPKQAAAVREAIRESREPGLSGRWLAEVAAYVGGVFMLGGGILLLATAWDDLTDPGRAAVLGAVALLLAGAGLAVAPGVAGLRRLRAAAAGPRRRVVAVLVALAAGAAAGAAGILPDEYGGIAAGAAGLLVAAAGYAVVPASPGLLASVVMSVILSTSVVVETGRDTPFRIGLCLALTGAAWVLLGTTGVAVPRSVAMGAGAVLALYGAQQIRGDPAAEPWSYGLTAAIGLACFALYRAQRAPVLLVIGVVAMAVAAPEAVWDWTGGAVGGALVLIVAGAALLISGAFGLGMWRRRPAG